MGAPGAGKGTQAKSLSAVLKLPHISTGDILRQAIKQNTLLGKQAKKYVETGALVPDSLVTEMVIERISSKELKPGFILDGFPRNIRQAEDLDIYLKRENCADYSVMCLDAVQDVLIQRLAGRRTCRKCQAVFHLTNMPPKKDMVCDFCHTELYQRADDKEETVKNRLQVYARETAPVVEYYSKQNRLMRLNASRSAQAVLEDMLVFLGRRDVPVGRQLPS